MTVTSMPPAPTLAPPPAKEDDKTGDGTGEVAAVDTHSEVVAGVTDQAAPEQTTAKTDAPPTEEPARERDLPKALVKPQVLTHVIEGFVIQEGTNNHFSHIFVYAQNLMTFLK